VESDCPAAVVWSYRFSLGEIPRTAASACRPGAAGAVTRAHCRGESGGCSSVSLGAVGHYSLFSLRSDPFLPVAARYKTPPRRLGNLEVLTQAHIHSVHYIQMNSCSDRDLGLAFPFFASVRTLPPQGDAGPGRHAADGIEKGRDPQDRHALGFTQPPRPVGSSCPGSFPSRADTAGNRWPRVTGFGVGLLSGLPFFSSDFGYTRDTRYQISRPGCIL